MEIGVRLSTDLLRSRFARLIAASLVTLLTATIASAQSTAVSKATTSKAAREDAILGIPFRNLSPPAQQRLYSVVGQPTMFRRMPISVIECDPELHRFLVRYPEVVVNIWQLMGITKVSANRVAPYLLDCADGVGTVTNVELIYGDNNTHVIYCEGSYEGPLFRKPLTGRCVLVLKSGTVPTPTVGFTLTNRLDVFVQVDHAGVDVFARTLHPLLGKSADINFLETMNFLQRMSRTAESNGDGMQHLASRLLDVDERVRTDFQGVLMNVAVRNAERLAATNAQHAESSSAARAAIGQPRMMLDR